MWLSSPAGAMSMLNDKNRHGTILTDEQANALSQPIAVVRLGSYDPA